MKLPHYLAWYQGRMYEVVHLSWDAGVIDELIRVEMIATTEPFETIALFRGGIDAIVLRQFTGHRDRNGKKIYDGDIVIADWFWTEPHAIVWPHDQYDFVEYGLDSDNVTVIGNIYEHPHLLEVKS